jgi:hypothetical protein
MKVLTTIGLLFAIGASALQWNINERQLAINADLRETVESQGKWIKSLKEMIPAMGGALHVEMRMHLNLMNILKEGDDAQQIMITSLNDRLTSVEDWRHNR